MSPPSQHKGDQQKRESTEEPAKDTSGKPFILKDADFYLPSLTRYLRLLHELALPTLEDSNLKILRLVRQGADIVEIVRMEQVLFGGYYSQHTKMHFDKVTGTPQSFSIVGSYNANLDDLEAVILKLHKSPVWKPFAAPQIQAMNEINGGNTYVVDLYDGKEKTQSVCIAPEFIVSVPSLVAAYGFDVEQLNAYEDAYKVLKQLVVPISK